jgi:uncharacterized protein (DUF433 family)
MTRGQPDGPHAGLLSDPHYRLPLYHKAEAARIIGVPRNTLRNWAAPPLRTAYLSRTTGIRPADDHPGLITAGQPPCRRGPTIPFVGLAEAFVLSAFRQARVPMQRIRPALLRLEEQTGVVQALASERLRTDGAEVLWDYGKRTSDKAAKAAVGDLVLSRNGHIIFRPVIQAYLQRVTYEDSWARVINVGRGKVDVTVDPWTNDGQPTLARRGVAVADIVGRIRAGEPPETVADDYGLHAGELSALLELAA